MDATTAIQQAESRAKRRAIIDRVLAWIEDAETVDIVHETPTMKPESCVAYAPHHPTGELMIVLKLTGIKGIEACRIDDGDPGEWAIK